MVKISAAYTPHMSWLLTFCVSHACSIFVRDCDKEKNALTIAQVSFDSEKYLLLAK